MIKEFTVFCVVPWEYKNEHSGTKAKHNVVFVTEDERVAKLFIDGFGLSTIDVEVKETSSSHEKTLANDSIYSNMLKCDVKSKRFVPIVAPEPISGDAEIKPKGCKCAFCGSTKVVSRVITSVDKMKYFCCSYCEQEAMDQGYTQVQDYHDNGDCS